VQRLGQPGSREACRRILNRWLLFPSIRPSLAGLRSWLRAEMTLLTGTGDNSVPSMMLRGMISTNQEVIWEVSASRMNCYFIRTWSPKRTP